MNDRDTDTTGEDARQRASPFKFLDPYGPEDAAFFFGRGFEIAELYARLYSGPLTVVYGESGTGKTSLIQCGLRNRVRPEDILFVFVRTALDPETTLRQELAKAVASAPDAPEDLDALVRRVIQRSYKTLVLVFDQFEEFFLFQPESGRESFARRLSGWLDQGLNPRLVIAMREEFLAHLTELEEDLPGLYENRLWLRRMGREQAQEAIAGPCRVAGVPIEPELIAKLLDTLGAGGQGVELPILQVVLDTLYRRAAQPEAEAPALTLQAYRDLGEVRTILARFVDDRLARYEAEAEPARQVLKALVTAEGTRRLTAPAQIGERLLAFGTELSEENLIALLRRLVDDRVLREDPERPLFELRHDALAQTIRQWMTGLEQELVDVRQTLESRLREYRQHGRLLDHDVLADLAPYEGRLRLRGDLADLVARSKDKAKRRQRIRNWTATAVAVLMTAVGAFSVVLWQEAEGQKKEAEGQRKRAEANFFMAKRAVDELYTEVSESDLLNKPGLTSLRQKLLEKALGFYQEFSNRRAEDPELQVEVAGAAFRLGSIKRLLGDTEGANEAYLKAIDLQDRLVREHPEVPEYQSGLAGSYHSLGVLQEGADYWGEAEESFQKAIKIRERVAREHPDVPGYQRVLTTAYHSLGVLQQGAGHQAEAEESYEKAIKIQKQLAREHPDMPDYRYDLANSYHSLGLLQQNTGHQAEAEESHQKAIKIQEHLVREYPEVPDYRNELARSYSSLGVLQAGTGHRAEAEESYQKAIEIREQLAREHPEVATYRGDFAQLLGNLASIELFARHPREAIAAAERALKIDPTQVWIQTNRAHGYLFDEQYAKAVALYIENKDVKLPEEDGKTFGEVVLKDFKEFRAKGLTHPDMTKIERILRGSGPRAANAPSQRR